MELIQCHSSNSVSTAIVTKPIQNITKYKYLYTVDFVKLNVILLMKISFSF